MVNKFLHPNGGSETYIFKLGEALVKLGHEVQYFGMEHEGRCVGNRANAYTSDMDFHGGSKLSKLTYPIKTIYSSEARKKIRLVLDDFEPDVVHLNNFNYQLTPSVILEVVKWRKEKSRDCKIIFTAHDYQLLCPNHMFNNPQTHENCEKCVGGHFTNCIKGRCIHGSAAKSFVGAMEAYFWKYKGTYKYIDKIICCSEFMKTKMDTNPVFAGKTIAMHNFITHADKEAAACGESTFSKSSSRDKAMDSESTFSESASYDNAHEDKYVLYFGRYSWEKGIKTLIKACEKLPDINFIFAGSGEYAEEIEKLPNGKNVGFKTGEELDALIRNAEFTVYPSEWYENCPFSVMESQERLVPVVGANIGGIPELVEDNKTGRLFTSGDAKELADTIKNLWNNPEELGRYRENLKELKRLDADEYARELLTILGEV